MGIITAVIVLGILVIVHEFGHFIVAKMFKVGVLEYSIGFGKKIWQKKKGETWYSLRAIPLGGYVSMAGEDPHTVYGEEERNNNNSKEDNKEDNAPKYPKFYDEESIKLSKNESRWFLNKPVWQKFLIVFAGPFFNILFAFLVGIAIVCFWGVDVPLNKPIVGDVVPDYPAAKAGIKADDRIVSINGVKPKTWTDVARFIAKSQDGKVNVAIRRKVDDRFITKNVSLVATEDSAEMKAISNSNNKSSERLKIGIVASSQTKKVPLIHAPLYSLSKLIGITVLTYRGFKGIINGAISAKHIGGPIEIVNVTSKVSKKGFNKLLDLMIFISMSLAIMNLLPIPILDGGHLMFFTIEFLIRRPVPLKVQALAGQLGMFILFSLMIFATGNDLFRLFHN